MSELTHKSTKIDMIEIEYSVKWSEGPIPSPTGPSILLLETNNETPTAYVCMSALDYWPKSGHAFSAVNMIEFFEDDYTGRWCIQTINLPKK